MSFRQKPKTVQEWLTIAIVKLAPFAQKRICSEIVAHYREAVAEHQNNGLSQPEAEQAALAELGDVYAARKRFRKTYLLESEEERLRQLWNGSQKAGFLLGLLYISPAVAGTVMILHEMSDGSLAAKAVELLKLAIAYLFIFIVPSVSRAISKRHRNRKALLLLMVSESLSFTAGGYGFFQLEMALRWTHEIPYLALVIWFLMHLAPSIHLLKRTPQDWPQRIAG